MARIKPTTKPIAKIPIIAQIIVTTKYFLKNAVKDPIIAKIEQITTIYERRTRSFDNIFKNSEITPKFAGTILSFELRKTAVNKPKTPAVNNKNEIIIGRFV
jgi:hypothetical protein